MKNNEKVNQLDLLIEGENIDDDAPGFLVEQINRIARSASNSKALNAAEKSNQATQEDVVNNADFICKSIKCDMQSLEHPYYALSKQKDIEVRVYNYVVSENGRKKNIKIEITPSVLGRATIYDKDILTYCASIIMQAINEGKSVSSRVRFCGHRYLLDTKRAKSTKQIGGREYDAIEKQLKRLKGTMISTNVPSNGKIYDEGFNLIDNYLIIRDEKTKRMEAIEVVLSKYYYEAIINKQVLTQSPQYYEIKHPFKKRIYELARKHCGNQSRHIAFKYKNFYNKTGSTSAFNEFMRMTRNIIKENNIPEYGIYENKEEKKFYLYLKSKKAA